MNYTFFAFMPFALMLAPFAFVVDNSRIKAILVWIQGVLVLVQATSLYKAFF